MPYVLLVLSGLLPVFLAIFRYWKRTHIKVNCWFCGLDNVILKKCHDGWVCKHCEQYNGFKSDGDYNRDIPAQWDSSLNGKLPFCSPQGAFSKSRSNGLCHECNRNQELKIAQLASFQPINPENYDDEIENFSYHLERAYRLCPPCESVLEDTLSHKKIHVLGINLQMTGKRGLVANCSSLQSALWRIVLQISSLITSTIGAIITICKLSNLCVETVPHNSPSPLDTNGVSSNNPTFFVSYIFSLRETCLWEKAKPTPELGSFYSYTCGYLEPFILSTELHLPLCISGLVLQGVSSWNSGSRLLILLWASLAALMFIQENKLLGADYVKTIETSQVIFLVLILACSWLEKFHHSSSPIKKLPKEVSESRKMKKKSICNPENISSNYVGRTMPLPSAPVGLVLPRSSSCGEIKEDKIALKTPNYMALPSRAASVLSVHSLTSAAALNKSLSTTGISQCTASQEDARSDASVDSAFSNTDSITLDGVESLNACSQFLPSKGKGSDDDEVHSLIGGLSIGSRSRSQSLKGASEFKKKQYLVGLNRNSLLSPSKLANIVNESMSSSTWHITKGSLQSRSGLSESINESTAEPLNQTVTKSLNTTLGQPSSPASSVHSHATAQSVASPGFYSQPSQYVASTYPSSFQQCVASAFNAPVSSQSTLSVCVPPNSFSPRSGFGNIAPLPSSPQIIYTPYGLYHQVAGPFGSSAIYMGPPQSPVFSRSPSSSYDSQFSPQSFSTSSCDSGNDFLPKSSKENPRKSPMSSSFCKSLWQSRFAIMYTTLCYLLLGSIVCAFSYGGVASKIIFKVLNWKQILLSSIS